MSDGFCWWEVLTCFNRFQVDDVTVGLMVQQFLDEWHFRVLHSGLAYAWDRPEATKRHQHVLFPCFESQYQDAQAWCVDRELNMCSYVVLGLFGSWFNMSACLYLSYPKRHGRTMLANVRRWSRPWTFSRLRACVSTSKRRSAPAEIGILIIALQHLATFVCQEGIVYSWPSRSLWL